MEGVKSIGILHGFQEVMLALSVSPMNRICLWMALFWIASTYPATSEPSGDPLRRQYVLHADFSKLSTRKFPISMEIEVENRGKQAISELWMMIYPNRFKKTLPNLNDLNYRRIYPDGFS